VPSQIVHDSDTIRIGAFRSRPTDPDFGDSGPTRGHLLVFPREPVTITHPGRRPIIADPSVVMIYNRGQQYTRRAISPIGDRCEWFAYNTATVVEAAIANALAVHNDDRPFGELSHAPSTPRCYMLARIAFDHAGADFVDELTATLLDEVLRQRDHRPALPRSHVELAEAIRRWLSLRYADRLTLAAIARAHGVSVFHLARVFRRATGRSIHAYRTELRLRAALERLADGVDVSTVAFDLGFSSHSHFTSAFRRAFGITPSQLRPSKILTAARRLAAR
jgi:AraC family transcriptional regulator